MGTLGQGNTMEKGLPMKCLMKYTKLQGLVKEKHDGIQS
jgi:hypothetical protein